MSAAQRPLLNGACEPFKAPAPRVVGFLVVGVLGRNRGKGHPCLRARSLEHYLEARILAGRVVGAGVVYDLEGKLAQRLDRKVRSRIFAAIRLGRISEPEMPAGSRVQLAHVHDNARGEPLRNQLRLGPRPPHEPDRGVKDAGDG